jgi:hypothetical protein
MCVNAQSGSNFLFTFDRFLQEKKKSFSHFMGNVTKKGRVAPLTRYVIHSDQIRTSWGEDEATGFFVVNPILLEEGEG